MGTRVKRTYNLSPEAVTHVRDLATGMGQGMSQDGIVEQAIESLYRSAQAHEEAHLWARASEDPSFQDEMSKLSAAYRDKERWPAG